MPGKDKIEIMCEGELLILSAARAIYWPAQRLLVLADLHLGKTGYFRAHGIPVSTGVVNDDLERLSGLIREFRPLQVLVAGDLFHHRYNSEVELFRDWRKEHETLSFLLVPGNHDRHMNSGHDSLGITMTRETHQVGPFRFIHEMTEIKSDCFTISGHLHPGYTISGKARQSLCLPCFIKSEQHLVLPAFSQFAGMYTGASGLPGQTHYVISERKLFEF
ncbi:ligase-associated DNA damage response endonuclease PdeM [Niabella beijingensis]|uniref:ligase-associated DNA damage response endonuclease PdeM n=1 Tax=Niabella beijingensis TaxID=2872700 RepID=UPI001CBAF156|nr:ligase-associated DNA damage response endonuclease PdeM [Niabella beijingensis]MBZ4187840.1 ligase-associated DNA damage response endonuclease PdeM [Niabella beijingensis]